MKLIIIKKIFYFYLKPIDFFNKLCYNNNCQEEIVGKLQGKVLGNLKKSKKPFDNGLPPCYNNNCQEGIHPKDDTETKVDNGRTETRQRKAIQKIFKFCLKTS